jgi:hypothetical protein
MSVYLFPISFLELESCFVGEIILGGEYWNEDFRLCSGGCASYIVTTL